MKKYELLENDFINLESGERLCRIKALIDFCLVKAGTLGGFIQKEENLDQDGNAWVSGHAWVHGNARENFNNLRTASS